LKNEIIVRKKNAERKILATLDPVASMAQGDPVAYEALISNVNAESLWVRDLIRNTAATPHTIREQLVLLLVNGASAAYVESYAAQRCVDATEARGTLADARKRITVAADFTRDEQIGRAVMRLEDLYSKSMLAHDARTALQAQRELNRLLDLYASSTRADAGPDDSDELRQRLALVAAHLIPLKLADDTYPIEEHARLAAAAIRDDGD
jgi:hypothetical protein